MAPDTRARHRMVAQLAGRPATLLDVGGSPGELGCFLPRSDIVTANIEPGADVLFDGDSLPFADEAFDVAVSVDVIEHIPKPRRAAHLAELARVARDRVVVCCPFGSAAHDAAERELAEWYARAAGVRHRFLDEHIERGLPDEAELIGLARAAPVEAQLLYEGSFLAANEVFRAATELKQRPTPRRAWRYARLVLRTRGAHPLQRAPGELTNRAYLIGTPTGQAAGVDPPSRP